jgi:hypothetical protein
LKFSLADAPEPAAVGELVTVMAVLLTCRSGGG